MASDDPAGNDAQAAGNEAQASDDGAQGPASAAAAAPPPPWKLPLRHRYFALRHGESEANRAGVIVSDPDVGCKQYGLTDAGKTAVAATAMNFAWKVMTADRRGADLPVNLVSSDFLRTRETARIFGETLESLGQAFCLQLAQEARERFFGELEGGPNNCYEEVWTQDQLDPNSEFAGAESVMSVRSRMVGLVASLEEELEDNGSIVVIVAHGDSLQILQTAFACKSPAEHRNLPHLNPAEVRELTVGEATAAP